MSVLRLPLLLLLLLAALGIAAASPAGAQSGDAPSDSARVAALVERFHGALERGDSATALALLAPDAVILESGGSETVAEYRGHHLPADIEFARSVKEVRRSLRVTVRGDMAFAAASSEAQGQFRTRAVNSTGVELMVFTRVAGDREWRIVAIHWSTRRRT